jgi:hypothetical protein
VVNQEVLVVAAEFNQARVELETHLRSLHLKETAAEVQQAIPVTQRGDQVVAAVTLVVAEVEELTHQAAVVAEELIL